MFLIFMAVANYIDRHMCVKRYFYTMNTKSINLRKVPTNIARKAKSAAALRDMTIEEFCVEAIAKAVDEMIPQHQAARTTPPIPTDNNPPPKIPKAFKPVQKTVVEEIVESEDGWEGSDPTLLKGTKVTI